jgi:drug/metabolite transporter (DMT)-like permease
MDASQRRWTSVLLVLGAAALFGTLGVLSRAAYDAGLAPFAWTAWRATVAAVGLWAVIAWRAGPRRSLAGLRAASPTARRALIVAGVAGAVLNLSIFLAFQRTAIALALLAFYTYPAMVAATAAALGRERLDRTRLVALGLAVGGMVAVVGGGLAAPAESIASGALAVDGLGIGLAFLAAVCQTTFVLVSHGYSGVPTDEAMASILVVSAVVAAMVSLVVDGPAALAMPVASASLLGLLVLVGVFAAALPSMLFLTGIRRLGPVRAGIVMLFEPVVGVVLAAIFLGERATPLQAVGGVTILAAAVLVQRRPPAGPAGDLPAMVAPAPGGP